MQRAGGALEAALAHDGGKGVQGGVVEHGDEEKLNWIKKV
jgi:hypothetical protein